MPGGMERMIQMITQLAEMQDRRRKLALEEDQLKTSKEQFAGQMGFNEKGQKQAMALKLLDAISTGGVDAHVAAPQLAQLLGFNSQESQVFTQAAPNATAALQMFSMAQQQKGLESMTPQQQQAGQQQAYLTNQAQTTPGQMAGSNLQAKLLSTPLSADMMQRAGEGAVIRQATGQDPFAFAVGQAGKDQGLAPAAAAIGSGVKPSWMNQAQDQYWRGSLQNDANRGQGGGLDMGSISSLMNTAHQISKDLAEGKYANENLKQHMVAQYNSMAPLLGLPKMTDKNMPDKTGFGKQQLNKLGGMDIPGVDSSSIIRRIPPVGVQRY